MNASDGREQLTIGYFGIRAKAQVCRLLCEHLGLPYRDRFFTPDEWEQFQATEARAWVIRALPFLKDGEFVVTGQQGMIEYIVRKAGQPALLGRTARDRIRLDAFRSKYDIKDNIIALLCQVGRPAAGKEALRAPEFYWQGKIYPKLKELEAGCPAEEWFLGYLSVADFALYEMMNAILWLFPQIAHELPKLDALRRRLLALERVAAYEGSERAVKVFNPICFFKEFEKGVEAAFRAAELK